MSSILITGLVLGGLLLLITIAYITHIVERHKLKTARQRAELADQAKRCAVLAGALPGQLMTVELQLALARLELQWSQRLNALDKRNPKIPERIAALSDLLGQAPPARLDIPLRPITSDAQADEIRLRLEDLHLLFARAARDGLLPASEASQWQAEMQRLLVLTHLEHFNNQGQRAMKQGQPRHARLAFERAVQYVRKQPDPSRYASQLRQLESNLARADSLALSTDQPEPGEASELTAGLAEEIQDEGAWKKKNLYE